MALGNDVDRTDRTVRSAVLDFDGAVCPYDVTEELLRAFAPPTWWEIEQEMRARRLGLREALVRQGSLLTASRQEMLDFVVDRFQLDATFRPFVAWARSRGIHLAVASDGLGFYIGPMLERAGILDVMVLTNDFGPSGFRFPFGHPACVGCGTCKMNAVLRSRDGGAVAFVGEGYSDRFGALYADLTFAKHHLAKLCDEQGIPFLPWDDFDDVRQGLDAMADGTGSFTGPVAPDRCPGWTDPRSPAEASVQPTTRTPSL